MPKSASKGSLFCLVSNIFNSTHKQLSIINCNNYNVGFSYSRQLILFDNVLMQLLLLFD